MDLLEQNQFGCNHLSVRKVFKANVVCKDLQVQMEMMEHLVQRAIKVTMV